VTPYARCGRRAAAGLTVFLALMGSTAHAVCGQSVVEGIALDAATGTPIAGAHVTLYLDDRVTVVAAVVTGEHGRFRFLAPQPGRYFVSAAQIGYGPLTHGPVEVRAGERAELELRLKPEPVELDLRTPSGGHYPTYLNETVVPGDVEGIEIYLGPSEVPPIFGGIGSGCGVVVVWTRDARPERAQPQNDAA